MVAGAPDRLLRKVRTVTVTVRMPGCGASEVTVQVRSKAIAPSTCPSRTGDGMPGIVPKVVISVNLPRKATGQLSALSIRGLTPSATSVRPEI